MLCLHFFQKTKFSVIEMIKKDTIIMLSTLFGFTTNSCYNICILGSFSLSFRVQTFIFHLQTFDLISVCCSGLQVKPAFCMFCCYTYPFSPNILLFCLVFWTQCVVSISSPFILNSPNLSCDRWLNNQFN